MYKIEFLELENSNPFIEFLESLSIKEQTKINAYIQKLLYYKNSNLKIPSNISKYLEDGVFELRVKFSDKISRSLYFYEVDKTIIFTNGFIKKTQKTPKSEIEKAKNLRKKYFQRKTND